LLLLASEAFITAHFAALNPAYKTHIAITNLRIWRSFAIIMADNATDTVEGHDHVDESDSGSSSAHSSDSDSNSSKDGSGDDGESETQNKTEGTTEQA
jgi:hypothetical protein